VGPRRPALITPHAHFGAFSPIAPRSGLAHRLRFRRSLNAEHGPDSETVKALLRYFLGHPHALDDLEGIVRWRLAEEDIRRKVEDTQRALLWLVARDYLRVMRTPAAAPLFGLNPERVGDAHALLASSEPMRGIDNEGEY
jgi:hypothetical protein